MIFDEDYDRSLWYIVKGDRTNRKELVNFIKELPAELIDKAGKTLAKAKKGEIKEDVSFSFQDESGTNVYYDFDYSAFDSCVTITKGIDDYKLGEDTFELILFPVNKELLEEELHITHTVLNSPF